MLLSGLLFSIFLEYVNPGSFFPVIHASKVGTVVPWLVFLFVMIKQEPVSNARLLSHPNTRWLLFFLLLVVVSIPLSDVTVRAFDVFRKVLGNVIWFVIIVKVVTDLDKLKMVFRVLVWSHILILLINPDVILEPSTRSYLRAGPFLGDGNDFALSVCLTLPMCLVLLVTSKARFSKAMYVVAMAILVLALVGTQSRGAALAFAGSLGFMWWHSSRKATGFVLAAIVLAGVVIFAPPQYFQRMETIQNFEQDQSAEARIIAWKTAIRMVKAHPAAGVGAGHFPIALGREFRPPEWGSQNRPWMTAHSTYFLILGELGLPGIVFLMMLLIGNALRLRRLCVRSENTVGPGLEEFPLIFLCLNVSLVAFCIAGAFLSATYYPHICVLAGLIVAATFIYEQTLESVQQAPETADVQGNNR